jgi:hypothetical protein
MMMWLLGQTQPQPYELLRSPLPVWDYWYLLALPLCLGISIVYKSIRCDTMRRVPREALVLCVFILVVMGLAAGALAALVQVLAG